MGKHNGEKFCCDFPECTFVTHDPKFLAEHKKDVHAEENPVKIDGRRLRYQRKLIPFSCCKPGCDFIGADENDMRHHKRNPDS